MPDYEYWLRQGLLGPFARVPRTLAAFRVHEGSATYSAAPPERAEDPVRILDGYFNLSGVPVPLREEKARALSNALLVSAQLHLRSGRYRAACARMREAANLSPRNLLRPRIVRQLANGWFNRLGHRLLWSLKRSPGSNTPPVSALVLTGASSFLGHALLAALPAGVFPELRILVHHQRPQGLSPGSRVITADGDLLKPDTLRELVAADSTVVHLAYLANSSPESKISVLLINEQRHNYQ